MIITIDGPTASGKSTIGRLVAQRLGFYYVNSGLFYRALAYLLLDQKGYSQDALVAPDMKDVQELLDTTHFRYHYDADLKEQILFDKEDITSYLHDDRISQAASIVSTYPPVRDEINAFIRRLSQNHNLIVDGRDAGTVIFPHADMKFFLTASLDTRVARLLRTEERLGNTHTSAQALEMITQRDQRDKEREVAPLVIPDDARVVDNSDMSRDQTLGTILELIRKNMR